jgi:hypothetical protein
MGPEYITMIKSAGSDIYLHWSTQVGKSASNIYTGGTRILRATDTAFTTDLEIFTGPNGSVGYTGNANYNYSGNWSHTMFDRSLTATAGTYYYMWQFKGGTTVTCNIDSGIGIMVAMEIKT